jgi:acyl-homoserine-lactone acylase
MMFNRSLRLIAAALAVLLVASSCGRARVQVPSPDTLTAQATIRRDTFGIPHIVADSEEAAAFAFGYAQAEDHAAAIGRRMISARGEEARYFGESGLSNDEAMAQFDNLAEARHGLTRISPLYRRIITAYAAGVNRYVEQHRAELPEWMPVLTPEDVLANGRSGAASALAGQALARQLRQKYETTTGGEFDAGDPDWHDEAPGSNAFALSGSRTVSGKPILLGNPHLGWSALYWEAHVRVPGKIDFYGSTLPGIPVLRAGFNDRLAFVTTNNAPDLDDVYAFQVDASGPDRYQFDGRSMPLTKREVAIAVRGADGGLRNELRQYWNTHLGPVIYRTGTHVFSPKSTRLNAFRYFEGFYLMSKARNLDAWLAALRQNLVPTSNFTYADADGNVLYQWNGQVPVRRNDGTDYRLDVKAESRADVWSTLHSVDDLPRLLNPPGGYVQNANNPPQFVSRRDPLDMSGYPSYIERGALALRPQLAIELLESREKFSREDVIRLKYDTRMLLADRVKEDLLAAVAVASELWPVTDTSLARDVGAAKEGARILQAWDNRVAAESRGAVLFQRFWDRFSAGVRQPFVLPWQPDDPFQTPRGLDGRSVDALIGAVRETRQAHGSADVAWGDVNRFRFGDVDLPGDGASGTYGAFRVLRFDQDPDGGGRRIAGNVGGGRPLVGFGDAWVLLVDFAEGRATGWSVLAYGQTTHLGSPHSRDQIRIFAAHNLRRAWYTEAEIRANLEREYRP